MRFSKIKDDEGDKRGSERERRKAAAACWQAVRCPRAYFPHLGQGPRDTVSHHSEMLVSQMPENLPVSSSAAYLRPRGSAQPAAEMRERESEVARIYGLLRAMARKRTCVHIFHRRYIFFFYCGWIDSCVGLWHVGGGISDLIWDETMVRL